MKKIILSVLINSMLSLQIAQASEPRRQFPDGGSYFPSQPVTPMQFAAAARNQNAIFYQRVHQMNQDTNNLLIEMGGSEDMRIIQEGGQVMENARWASLFCNPSTNQQVLADARLHASPIYVEASIRHKERLGQIKATILRNREEAARQTEAGEREYLVDLLRRLGIAPTA